MRYNKFTTLGFAETQSQWQTLNAYRDSSCFDLQIVAVTPEVEYLALCSRQPYLSIEDFYYWEHICKLGEENVDIAERFCDQIDNIIHSLAGRMQGVDLVSFRALFHPFKGFLDSVTMRLAPVEAVFKYIQPCSVVCFPQPEYQIKGANLLDKPSLSLTSRIVPLIAGARNCGIDWLPNNEVEVNAESVCSYQHPSKMDEPAREKELLDSKINLLQEAQRRYKCSVQLDSSKPLLFSNSGLDNFTAKILNSWHNYYGGIVFDIKMLYTGQIGIDPRVIETALGDIGQSLWNTINQVQAIRQIFKTRNVDYYSLISPLLSLLVRKELPRLLFRASIVERNVSGLKNTVVMMGGMADINNVIAKACSKFKIPMVSTHRGGYLGYCQTPFHERYEFADADYYLSGGLGAAQTFTTPSPMTRWRPERKRATPVVTGSVWVDELVAQYRKKSRFSTENIALTKQPKRKTIMYVMSALLGDNCYIGYVFHPEIWLWRFQFELINFLARFPQIDVILKPPISDRYPQITNPIFDWLKGQNPANVSIFSQDIALEKILDRADAFIIDSPSSPLWPLVASEKPFAAYIDRAFFRLVPQAAEMLKKRAVFADNREEFFANLGDFLTRPQWAPDKPVNDEFLCHYGTYLNDGNSDKRVTEFLYQLTARTHRPITGENNEQYTPGSQYVGS